MSAFLGIDLGTSALKAVAVDTEGGLCARVSRSYPTVRPEPAAAEQDPAQWWRALLEAIDELADIVAPERWSGIGLSAMLPTLVEFEGDSILPPAITWEDARAETEAQEFIDEIGAAELYRITGQRVDGRYLAPMHARRRWLGGSAEMVAGAKDALFWYLTGTLLTDPSTAAGYGVFDLLADTWGADLVAAAGIRRLPDVAPASTGRPLRAELARRWAPVPVVLGAADSVLGAAGLGAHEHGDVAVVAGTSAIVLGISDAPTLDDQMRYLVTPLAGRGFGLEMDLLAMGSAFEAIAAVLGLSGPDALLEAAAEVSPGEAPLFLPYLAPGEQGALWDPGLRGTVHGLALGMNRSHVARALVTGVVNELRRCIEVLGLATGTRGPVLLGGGAAVSPLLQQDLADATGRDVLVDTAVTDPSALGAALFAAHSLGSTLPRIGNIQRVTPRPDAARWWDEAAHRHDALRRNVNRKEEL
ncbi:hypothetical protein DVS77_30630 [Mycolicibacterium moriokaense]|nr:hypothetical protein DVS77_30630 [Mycolicibacterium moriokaense]